MLTLLSHPPCVFSLRQMFTHSAEAAAAEEAAAKEAAKQEAKAAKAA